MFPKFAFNWWHWWCNAMMACLFSSLCESVYEVVGRLEAAKIRFTQLEIFTWGGTFSTFGNFSSIFSLIFSPIAIFSLLLHIFILFCLAYLQHGWFLDDPFGDNFRKGFYSVQLIDFDRCADDIASRVLCFKQHKPFRCRVCLNFFRSQIHSHQISSVLEINILSFKTWYQKGVYPPEACFSPARAWNTKDIIRQCL